MKIIKERKQVENVYYCHEFQSRNNRHAGYSFDCDKSGKLDPNMCPEARENYQKCIDGVYDVIDVGVQCCHRSYMEDAEGVCDVCGKTVALYDAFASVCDNCGTEYNGAGQQVAPRYQWGEETGEMF